MNLYELNAIIERVKDDEILFAYYTQKRNELLQEIKEQLKTLLNENND